MKKLKLFAVALITAFAGILNVNAETVQPELAVIGGKNVLIANGVAENRIIADHKGDTVQPFEKAEQNRVVICTLE